MIDLKEMLLLLHDHQVEFVIIGGVAANLLGAVRPTFDLDLCYSRTPANLARLAGALAPLQPRLRDAHGGLPFTLDPLTLRNGLLFTLETDLGWIDLLGEVPGIGTYEKVRAAANEMGLLGRTFWVLTLPALIAAKKAAGRGKDLEALHELEALREATSEQEE
jgi:predicted nucleotidyltransferase